jgi:hypothetical protein
LKTIGKGKTQKQTKKVMDREHLKKINNMCSGWTWMDNIRGTARAGVGIFM